jgi:hypothetical protein
VTRGSTCFKDGYPASVGGPCGGRTEQPDRDDVERSGLVYDAATAQYTYHWKTLKTWAGHCRTLIVKFNDGSSEFQANFKFK